MGTFASVKNVLFIGNINKCVSFGASLSMDIRTQADFESSICAFTRHVKSGQKNCI